MRYEVFEYQPQGGDYGSDWRLIYTLADKATAMHCAKLAFARDGVPLLVMTAPKTRIGRQVAQFGAVNA